MSLYASRAPGLTTHLHVGRMPGPINARTAIQTSAYIHVGGSAPWVSDQVIGEWGSVARVLFGQ